jgi:RNase P subunit RPR2
MKKESSNMGAKLGLAGLAVAGLAGAYFLYGKDGAKNRKAIKTWTLRAKADVIEKLEKAKEVSQGTFDNVVDEISAKYGSKMKDVSMEDVTAFAKDLKKHWKDIKGTLAPKVKTAVKKAVKKTVKK